MRRRVGREVALWIRLWLKWVGKQGVRFIDSNDSSGNRRFRVRTTQRQGELGSWAGAEFRTAESKCATSD